MKNKFYEVWIYTLSIFISLFACRNILEKSNFTLTNFSDRTIGTAVLHGVDIASRSLLYFKLVAIFVLCFLICSWIFSRIWRYAKNNIGLENLRKDSHLIFVSSTFSIFILIFHYINGAEIFVGILDILKLLTILSLSVLICKVFARRRDPVLFELFNNYNFVILSFLLPLVVFFARWIIIHGSFIFTKVFFIFYLAIWAAYWLILRTYFKFVTKKLFNTKVVSVLSASIPLLLIPLSAPLLNELQYSFSSISDWSIKHFEIVGLIVLIIVSLLIFLFNKSKDIKFKFSKYIYLPIFVATVTLFNMHLNFLDISYLDMFHHGENLISTQQLFLFGKIPFIDLYPTHGISYMIGQVLYSLVNGYQPFAPWLWEWITKLFEVLVFYFLLTEITNSFFASVAIVFLPIIGVFGGQALVYGYSKSLPTTYYFAPFLVGLILIWTLKNINFKSMLALWIGCLFMTTWRIDFGIACFASSSFIIFMSVFRKYLKSKKLVTDSKSIFTSLAVVVILGVPVFTLVALFKSESVLKVITEILEFIKFQGQAQGLIPIIPSYSPISVFQYLILPFTGVFYVLYYLYRILFKKDSSLPKYKTLLLYVAIFSLIISVRSVQRQTLAILGYNPYLFAFLLLCLPFYIAKTKNNLSALFFTVGLLIYQFVLPNGALLLKSGQQVTLYNWRNKERRVHVDNYQYKNILVFLNSNLDSNQTFLDLSSSPLLYVVSNRKFISYLIPSAYHTSEVIQKNELSKIVTAYNSNEIPVVIFRQPYLDANNIDNVPNEMRSYRIYEFINSHYHPVGYVMGYFIWISNNSELKNTFGLIKDTNVIQQFNLQKLPFIWGAYDANNAKDNTGVLETLLDKPIRLNPTKPFVISLNKDIDKTSGNYLHFKIQSNQPGTFVISYSQKPISQFTFDLVQSNKPEDYLIRISSQYCWVKNNIDSLKISSSVDADLTEGYIRKGD